MDTPLTLLGSARQGHRWSTPVGRCWFVLLVAWALATLVALPTATAQQQAARGAAKVEAITVREERITLQVGQTKQIVAEVKPASAAGQPLKYESGNSGFFTVDAKGVVTAVHEGSSALSIIAPNGVRTDVRVEVVPKAAAAEPAPPTTGPAGAAAAFPRGVPDEGIVLGNAGGEIEIGSLERIIAHVLPYQVIGSNPFTVSSSDPAIIAAIDEAKVISAVKEGTATVTVATLDGKHKASATYTVVPRRTGTHPEGKTYTIEPERFGIRYDDASVEAATANSAGLYNALKHTADNGFNRLLLEPKKVLYVEPKDTIHMVSNVQLDLNGSEIRLRPNDYPNYVAFLFAEKKDRARVLENASIVNGIITGERDEKEKYFPNWAKTPATEAGCTIVFDEGVNNGIRNLTVRKSIGFNMSSGLGSKSHGVVHFAPNAVSVRNMELGGFDDTGKPTDAKGLIRTVKPLDVSKFGTPHYTIGYPLGYMGYPYMNSRIYDAYFFDKDMKLLSAERGRIRFRQYALPQGTAFLHLAFYQPEVPKAGNSDFGGAFAFVENRAMPIRNYMIGCTIEDNFSTGFAACGGQGWLIQDNVFRRNGGRMPGCDIDWEDGWEYMQGDLVEGNTFESRLNVITCAGAGLVFRNNTFRGESVFYGRSQHYSLLNNVFEKATGEKPNSVKVAFASQTDIYAVGNRYTNASMGYSREHNKAPHVGTYEATFVNETFDNTQLLPGHLTRLVGCTIRNGADHSMISAENLENCTIEKGSYSAGGVIRNSTIDDAVFRVQPGKLLQVHDSKLKNPWFSAGAACEGAVIEKCQITVDKPEPVLVTPNNMSVFTVRDSTVKVADSATGWTIVGGWNATGANTAVTLDTVRFTLPAGFKGYLHKFAWYPPTTEAQKITYTITKTDLSKFQKTDEKGTRSNVVFSTASR